jgi:hypothetical protein
LHSVLFASARFEGDTRNILLTHYTRDSRAVGNPYKNNEESRNLFNTSLSRTKLPDSMCLTVGVPYTFDIFRGLDARAERDEF